LAVGVTIAGELAGMPEQWRLERVEGGGQVFVYRGPDLFAHYDADDLGMRNLAIVGLTNAGFPGGEVATCFGLTNPSKSRR
jgi:hypothetical protein